MRATSLEKRECLKYLRGAATTGRCAGPLSKIGRARVKYSCKRSFSSYKIAVKIWKPPIMSNT